MGVFIAYGTNKCRTGKIAQAIASPTSVSELNIELFDTSGVVVDRHPKSFAKFSTAQSEHAHRHQWNLKISVIENRGKLQARQARFVSNKFSTIFEGMQSNAPIHVGDFIEIARKKYSGTLVK